MYQTKLYFPLDLMEKESSEEELSLSIQLYIQMTASWTSSCICACCLKVKLAEDPLEFLKFSMYLANYSEIKMAPLKHAHEIHN